MNSNLTLAVEIFPLVLLINRLREKFQEETKSDAGSQNIIMVYHLRYLKWMYDYMQSNIPGFTFGIPLYIRDDNIDDKYTVSSRWIIENDPNGLGHYVSDTVTITQTTEYKELNEATNINITTSGSWPRDVVAISKFIPPHIMDEAVKEFCNMLGVYVPCPAKKQKRGPEDSEFYYMEHPDNCKLCDGEFQIPLDKFIKFRPNWTASKWFETGSCIYDYIESWNELERKETRQLE